MPSLINEVLAVIFLINSCLPPTKGVLCYKCTIVAPPAHVNVTKRLCSDFDASDKFIVDCPYSTFCVKKTYTVDLNSVLVNGTSRDCAQQMNVVQEYKNNRWERRILIEEPYTEGCAETDDKGQRSSDSKHCYCKGNLCNLATRGGLSIIPVIISCFLFLLIDGAR
ncbi:uncharacterized protein LOC116161749 [Photinus pyralis]|uniref:Protein sleepless n=1 Tax=Photinus pyralis TaxID=7054 RepID=A0A1Y1LLS9_PHOPY|nr:uncharacterized protein LOC116161749 [Photinus pyralis]